MSKLDELINQLCPDGVEFKPVWSLTIWDKKFNAVDRNKQSKVINYHYFLAGDLKPLVREDGTVKILTTNISNLFTSEELVDGFVSEGEIVCLPWGGNPVIQYYKGRFVTADNRIATSINTKVLSNKFLYYYLNNKLDEISSFYRGSGIKHPDMAKVLDMSIPVPPMEVQCEIVRILDNFTELASELASELTARRKQFDYYRDNLFSFSENVDRKTIGELSRIVTKQTGFDYSNYIKPALIQSDNGDCVPYMQTKNFSGLLFDYNTDYYVPSAIVNQFPKITLDEKCILFSIVGASIGNIGLFPNDKKCFLGGAVCVVKVNKDINIDYLYHFMSSKYGQKQIAQKTKGAGQATVTVEDIRNMVIPMPSLGIQNRIVSLLNKFDGLCSTMISGLPAEIEARQKQYEYYRDKLLTFKELKA